jgi:hypothetical protein
MKRNRKLSIALIAAALALLATSPSRAQEQDGRWTLEQSTLSYHVSHPVHRADGVSHAAQGQGVCHQGQCDFVITAPVKSFDSGSGLRDRHMQKVTHEEQFPTITVRTQFPDQPPASPTIYADLEIQFAGETAEYEQVAFQQETQGDEVRITGTIPAKVSDFKIKPPSLLTMAIKDDIPVRVEMTWRKEK